MSWEMYGGNVRGDVRGGGIADPVGSSFVGTISDGETPNDHAAFYAERLSQAGSVCGSASYINAFHSDTQVSFAGISYTTRQEDDRIELHAGGQIAVGQNSLF